MRWSGLCQINKDHAQISPVQPRSAPVDLAGRGVLKLQRTMAAQREAAHKQALDVHIRGLFVVDDRRRAAWVNLARFSTTLVTAWPCRDACLTNVTFLEV